VWQRPDVQHVVAGINRYNDRAGTQFAGSLTYLSFLRWCRSWERDAQHRLFTIDTDVPVYFCDPHSPWQRGSNENTNGLLRQYFPKSTDLRVYTPNDLLAAAAQLNSRPRKTLDWDTPAQRLDMLLNVGK